LFKKCLLFTHIYLSFIQNQSTKFASPDSDVEEVVEEVKEEDPDEMLDALLEEIKKEPVFQKHNLCFEPTQFKTLLY